MFTVRSFSWLPFVLAAVSLTTGCAAHTDDVYTPDEQRPDLAGIARGDVQFPVALGTSVPDAGGRPVTLTRGMEGIEVRFLELDVNGTCDSDVGGDGEFYYDMGIDDRSIARRPRERYQSLAAGESTSIAASRIFFVAPGETFTVHLDVSEYDDLLNGSDDHVGARWIAHSTDDLAATGRLVRSVELGSGDCDVVVTYSLQRVQ